jgi:Spy/CpxP family protein refolding chaperone
MNRWLLTGAVPVSLALSLCVLGGGVLGCSSAAVTEGQGTTAGTAAQGALAADGVAAKAPVVANVHGRARLAAEALGEVPLRADQRAQIQKLAATAEAAETAVRAARRDLTLAIADEIGGGQIDRAALQPKIDAIAAAALSSHTIEETGLQQLHGILDAGQRSLFVDAIQAKIEAHRQGGGEHMRGMAGMKNRWADLNLSDEQEAKVEAIMQEQFASHPKGDWKAGFERGQKTLEAFKGDVFTPPAPTVDVRAKTSEMTGRFVDIAARILPILTPEQRATAVQKLQARAAKLGASAPDTEENPAEPLL